MTPEQIAQGCVKHGVGFRVPGEPGWYGIPRPGTDWNDKETAERFINDGRVVLAIEKKTLTHPSRSMKVHAYEDGWWVEITEYSPNSDEEADPIVYMAAEPEYETAIITACLQALGGSDD